MAKAKICGLMRLEDIEAVNNAHPEMAGFVFADSLRQISVPTAQNFRTHLDNDIKTVGVFVEPDMKKIEQLAKDKTVSVIQIHGKQNQETVTKIQALGLQVTQVIHPGEELITKPDYVMYDGQNPGSGQLINWTQIKKPDQPVFLAGGLTPENVAKAIQAIQPDFVDVSSGVETDQQKDSAKISKFTQEAHNG